MRAKSAVVLGAQWGDEGKGKIVDVLSERFSAVARYAAEVAEHKRDPYSLVEEIVKTMEKK